MDKTGIYNRALLYVGGTTITSTTDDVPGVRKLDQFYEVTRDKLLAAYPWNFAIAQASLSHLSAAPTFGYKHAYQLPVDCLSVLKLSQDNEYRVVSGGVLETDYDSTESGAEALSVEYVKQVTDESLFSAHFGAVLSLALAIEITLSMNSKTSLIESLYQRYQIALSEAQAADWKNDKEPTGALDPSNDSWITGRA